MAQVIIKTTVAFIAGTTFIFGSWVCVTDGAGNFHHHIAPAPDKKQHPMKLKRQALEDLVEKFGKISISNLVRGWGHESKYNSTSPACRAGFHEPTLKPLCESDYDSSRFPFGL